MLLYQILKWAGLYAIGLACGILRTELNVVKINLTKICWAPNVDSRRGGWVKVRLEGRG